MPTHTQYLMHKTQHWGGFRDFFKHRARDHQLNQIGVYSITTTEFDLNYICISMATGFNGISRLQHSKCVKYTKPWFSIVSRGIGFRGIVNWFVVDWRGGQVDYRLEEAPGVRPYQRILRRPLASIPRNPWVATPWALYGVPTQTVYCNNKADMKIKDVNVVS